MKGRPLRALVRGIPRTIYLVGVANLVQSAGRSAAWLFLPLLLYTAYHLSFLQVGLLAALIVPVTILASLIGGSLSDRLGRRPFVAYPPLVNAGVSFLTYAFWSHGVVVLMGLWAVNSFLGNVNGPAQNSMVSDVTPVERRLDAFSLLRVFGNAGFAIAPAVGGVLADQFGLPVVFLLAGTASLAAGVFLVLKLEETRKLSETRTATARGALGFPFHDSLLLLVGVLGFGLTVASGQFGTALSLFSAGVRHLTYEEIGLLYSVNGILVVTLQFPISSRVTGHYLSWMAVGTLLYGLAFLLFDIGPTYSVDILAMAVLTLGEDLVSPLQNVIVASISGRDRRGSYFGAYTAIRSSASMVAPPVGTLLLGTGQPLLLWGTMAVLTVFVAGGYLALERGKAVDRVSSHAV